MKVPIRRRSADRKARNSWPFYSSDPSKLMALRIEWCPRKVKEPGHAQGLKNLD
jgi:hypothetical protein